MVGCKSTSPKSPTGFSAVSEFPPFLRNDVSTTFGRNGSQPRPPPSPFPRVAPGGGLPSVSVIIPAHNAERWLDEALASVANQTYGGPLEVRGPHRERRGEGPNRETRTAMFWCSKNSKVLRPSFLICETPHPSHTLQASQASQFSKYGAPAADERTPNTGGEGIEILPPCFCFHTSQSH